MDLSKLPKLSQTPAPPDNAAPAAPENSGPPGKVELFCRCGAPITPGTNFCSHCGANYYEAVGSRARSSESGFGTGAEAWISLALGLILILMAPRLWQFYFTPSKFTWAFNDTQGNPLPYPQTEFYWADLGLAAFSVVLFVEAILTLIARKPLVIIALALTTAATLLNVYILIRVQSVLGFQIINALVTAFGIYIVLCQLALIKSLGSARR